LIDPSGGLTYNLEEMRSSLNDINLLPGQTFYGAIEGIKYIPPGQPYNEAPWNYAGTEGDIYDSFGDTAFADAGYPETVVDWVLVSLRSEFDGEALCMAAALLHKDGSITMVDEFTCCELNPLIDYYVVIEHRNHLIVMSPTPVSMTDDGTIAHDFRHADSYSTDPNSVSQKFLGVNAAGDNVYCMYGANGDQTTSNAADTDINLNDLSFWNIWNNTISTYHKADYSMNADINLNDRIILNDNNGSYSSVPRN